MTVESTCIEIRKTLQAYALKTLPEGKEHTVSDHLDACESCRAALKEVEAKLTRLRSSLPVESPQEGLAQRTLARVENTKAERSGDRALWPALATGMVVLCVMGAVLLPVLSRTREASRRATSQNNMKQLGIIFKMYANESDGERYPRLAKDIEAWAPDLSALYGKYLNDPALVISPEHPERERFDALLRAPHRNLPALAAAMGENYAYLGYTAIDEVAFERLHRARQEGQLEEAGKNGADSVLPLREGIERFLITDINNSAGSSAAQSTIPVLIEVVGWKYKKSVDDFKGANVLYMDGHVEFVPLGTFPVVPNVMDVLSGLAP